MRTTAACIGLVGVLLGAQARAASAQPVKVTGGTVSGVPGRDASITVFKGLPFAAPPVGDQRWRAPKPVVPWAGTKKADRFGSSCIQTIVTERKPWTYEFMAHNEISEDCLYLNVWTGAQSPNERRPVYVYIHGGGNREGSGGIQVYDGEGLAKKGIVVVTINYRLGVFGFFVHPELTKESGVNASGNYALLDIIAALRWIHDNIAAFGGDPAKVTIGGQSAGAGNTHNLVASPLAKGLFRGAIAQSGSSYGPGNARRLSEAEPVGVKFAEAKGAHSLGELRKLPWQTIFEPVPGLTFGATVDGYVLKASPSDTFAAGTQNDVPTLTGGNRHDNNGSATAPDGDRRAVRRAGEAAVRGADRRVPEAVPRGRRWAGARVDQRVSPGQHANVAVLCGRCTARRRRRRTPGSTTGTTRCLARMPISTARSIPLRFRTSWQPSTGRSVGR